MRFLTVASLFVLSVFGAQLVRIQGFDAHAVAEEAQSKRAAAQIIPAMRGRIQIEKRRANAITVDIERMPMMSGTATKGGRIKATSKIGKTSIQGLDGKFSTAGTVNEDGVLNVVFVAEYYLQGKAYCTQSWNVSGLRKEAATPAPKAHVDFAEPSSSEAAFAAPWDVGQPMW